MALLHRLEDNAVTGADLAFFALTDIAFCRALIWLHQLHKRVRVVIDRKCVRSCPSAIESVELLIAAGIDVRHRNPIIHYKLLILTYKDDIFVSSGSANLTTAAWNRNDELLVQTMGPPDAALANRDGSFVWGDYLSLKIHPPPDARLLNLENAVTTTTTNYDVPLKGINYHMHAKNTPLIFSRFATATFEDNTNPSPYIISMANNHSLDFSCLAFENETLSAMTTLPGDACTVGVGTSILEAAKVARIELPSHTG
ncbi:hypothetical protein F442_10628 [Phytophthora nicotianae P10297]|uniref:Mitochondrial cardiolipin hydrolase n=1 Tax=Phytophthora nicotianae P10297 TaxID=1317064 RepID=W2Z507_PHYNI|nr:hypothetical protein F442_10628 [Phytophthora nicotianae P10297]